MKQFTRTITVENERAEGKTVEEDARRVLARLARLARSIPGVTVDDLGSEALPLRANDDRDKMVAAVRKATAELAGFIVTESPDEAVEEPVESLERQLSPEAAESTLSTLEARFRANDHLHEGCDWDRVKTALDADPEALWSVAQMEAQGHMPDVYNFDNEGFDIGTCSEETPASARNCVYDAEAAAWLKENYPNEIFNESAVEMAEAMGVKLMSPAQYETGLQRKDKFDDETRSWLLPDEATRKSGYAPVGSYRTGNDVYLDRDLIICHYASRAWRGSLRVLWT